MCSWLLDIVSLGITNQVFSQHRVLQHVLHSIQGWAKTDLVGSDFRRFAVFVGDPNFHLFKLARQSVPGPTQHVGLRHYLRKILFDTGNLETPVHLPRVLQRNSRTGCVSLPEFELLINLRISVVTLHKEFCLLKVGKGLEGKVGGSGTVEGRRVCQIIGTPWEICEFLCWYHPGCQFSVRMVNDECLPKLKWPCSWILSCTPGGSVWLA